MIGADGVDFLDALIMSGSHISELIEELLRRRLSNKEEDVLKRGGRPRKEDEESNEDGTDRVEIPNGELAREDCHEQTKDVDGNIVAVIDVEDVRSGVAAEGEAVEEENEFTADGDGDEDERNECEVFAVVVASGRQCTAGLDNELHGDGGHERAEHDDTNGLDTGTSNRILFEVCFSGKPGCDEHHNRGHEIHL